MYNGIYTDECALLNDSIFTANEIMFIVVCICLSVCIFAIVCKKLMDEEQMITVWIQQLKDLLSLQSQAILEVLALGEGWCSPSALVTYIHSTRYLFKYIKQKKYHYMCIMFIKICY